MAAKQNIIIFGSLLAIAAAFWVGRVSNDQTVAPPAPSARTDGAEAHSSSAPPPSPEQRPAQPSTQTIQSVKAQLFAEYRCQRASCNMSPFLAENENEALWLRQRGYPSERQREEAKRLPTIELKTKTDKGDLTAASLYGERLMEEGDYEKAYRVLLDPAIKGSLYALYGLSYNALNHPKYKNYTSARAYLRLAYLAGDYKATIQLTQTAPDWNGQAEQLIIDAEAAHKFRNLLQYRSYPRPPSKL